MTKFDKLSQEPLVKEASKRFQKDLSVTLTSLEEELSPLLGYKADRKVLKKVFESWGISRTQEENNKARVVSLKEAKNGNRDRILDSHLKTLCDTYGSKEAFVELLKNEKTSMQEVERRTGVSSYYQSAILKDFGVELKSNGTYNAEIVIGELAEVGWTINRLRDKYAVENVSNSSLLSEVRKDYPIAKRMFDRILKKEGIRKTPEQIKFLQSSKQRRIEEGIDLSIKESGYSIEELAQIYNNDYSHSYRSLTEMVNARLPKGKKIVETNLLRRISPMVERSSRSLTEDRFFESLKSLGLDVERNNRSILSPKELDFVIESAKVAIEFNGDYWHSDRFIIENHGVTAHEYHSKKFTEAASKGYRLLFVWESDWTKNEARITEAIAEAVSGQIPPILKIFSKTSIKRLNSFLIEPVGLSGNSYKSGNIEVREVSPSDAPFKDAREATKEDRDLIQVYPWDDLSKIARIINYKNSRKVNRLEAKRLQLLPLEKKELDEFMDLYHIQGSRRGSIWRAGLHTSDGELVAAGSFGKTYKNKWEFQRFAIKEDYMVVGGAGKIFKNFVRDVNPATVISYLDYSHTTKKNTFMDSLGFVESRAQASINWWRASDERLVKGSALVRLGADKILGTNYGPPAVCGMNNTQVMEAEGFERYKTAGNRVFIWTA